MSSLHTAIQHLEQGDWDAAHEIVQSDPTSLGSWAHGIVHIMEGDLANAGYWYRKAERELASAPDIAAEIEAEGRRIQEQLSPVLRLVFYTDPKFREDRLTSEG